MRQALALVALLTLACLVACGASATATAARGGGASSSASAAPPSVSPAAAASPSSPATAATPATLAAASGAVVTNTPTVTRAVADARTPTSCGYTMTGFTRNREVTAAAQGALVAAGLPEATVEASDAGENLVCTPGGTRFLLMRRAFRASLPAADLADHQALGAQLALALGALEPSATAPENVFIVRFAAPGGNADLQFNLGAWRAARAQNLTGAALYDRLAR